MCLFGQGELEDSADIFKGACYKVVFETLQAFYDLGSLPHDHVNDGNGL